MYPCRDSDTKHRCELSSGGLLAVALALALLAGCAGQHRPQPRQPPPTSRHQGDAVVRYALQFQGTPYVWGAESPEDGFDCSGFVQYVYGQHGVPLPRTAYEMAMALPSIERFERRPGDLVFFNTTGKPYSHVGIYIGRDSFVHASSAKHGVVISSLDQPYWIRHFLGMRRPDQPYQSASYREAGRGRYPVTVFP